MYFVTSPPGKVQSIAISVSVCLPACTSQKPHVPTSQNSLYMLPAAETRSSYYNNAIGYVTSFCVNYVIFSRNSAIQTKPCSLSCSELFTVTRQVAPLNFACSGKILLSLIASLWLPYVIVVSFFYLLFFPRLISAAAGWMSTIL